MKRKILAFILSVVFIIQISPDSFALTDDLIFSEQVRNTYQGRSEASNIIANINFTDVTTDNPARESIVQSGALNLIKGSNRTFSPAASLSKQEALAYLLRSIGVENEAIQLTATLQAANPSLSSVWSLGYLNLAMQYGLITAQQYTDATTADQTTINSATGFIRDSAVSRQQFAAWAVATMTYANPTAFDTTRTVQSIFAYNDWESIDADKVAAVEAVLANNIMSGTGGRFNPGGAVTKAEAAQALKNLDSIYFKTMNINKITGTVGGVKNNQRTETGYAFLQRDFYVRTADGKIDVISYPVESTSSPQTLNKDVVVYKNGVISGLLALNEGDIIEYLVDTVRKEALYIKVIGESTKQDVSGILKSIDAAAKTVTIVDSTGKQFVYPVSDGLMYSDGAVTNMYFDRKPVDIKTLPYGSRYRITLTNSIVTEMVYVGEPQIIREASGIVTENNPDFGYLTIVTKNGQSVTYQYFSNDIRVKKKNNYNMADTVGYLDQVFPHYAYNPLDSVITEIEAGDIVFLTLDPSDNETITAVSAAADYIMKYGKIKQLAQIGSSYQLMIEYENKQTAWFNIPSDLFVSKDGRISSVGGAQTGDWIKLLVNQAIIEPGYIIESAKEMVIEGNEHFISNIIKGQLAGYNQIQNTLTVQNAQTLAKTGWDNYKQVQNYNLSGKDIEFYNNGSRISLDQAVKYLKRADGEVYIALENNFTGEKIKKVTFRDGRDEILGTDTVFSSDGAGGFRILSNAGTITTDNGTIVRRHGRLVEGQNIMVPDYATVIVNGGNRAAVVDIKDAPDTSALSIIRGRIRRVTDGTGFTVQSMSQLYGINWVYSPIQREFATDYNTLFLNQDGYVDPATFIGYTADSVVDKVYTIIADGSKATRVIEQPYALNAVRGTIYAIDDTTVSIKDVTYYNSTTGIWSQVSARNNIASITLSANSIIGKNNQVVQPSALQSGDQIRVMTDVLPTIAAEMEVAGYIIFVEK